MPTVSHYLQGVFKSRTFVEMSEESLSFVLQSDKLKADESEVLSAVKEWSTVNAVSNSSSDQKLDSRYNIFSDIKPFFARLFYKIASRVDHLFKILCDISAEVGYFCPG